MKYSIIDLFAGAGGLSLGFEQTNKFEIKAAVEKDPDCKRTYASNHSKVKIFTDVCKIDYDKIKKEFGNIDVVIGGPPCQGFSNANRQKNHAISLNNKLVKQYVRAILELQPKAFVMENVSMLKSDIHRFYLETGDVEIVKKIGIPCIATELVLLEKAFMFDGAEKLIKNLDSIGKLMWSDQQYSTVNLIYKRQKHEGKLVTTLEKNKRLICRHINIIIGLDTGNKIINALNQTVYKAFTQYYENALSNDKLVSIIEQSVKVQRMLRKLKEIFDNHIVVDRFDSKNGLTANIRSFAVYDYIRLVLGSKKYSYILDSNVLCAADFGVPQKRMRFVIIGIKKNISTKIALPKGHVNKEEYAIVKEAISDIADIVPITDVSEDKGFKLSPKADLSSLAKNLRNSQYLYNHIITKTRDTALARFASLKPGENFHDLDAALKENTYTDISRTQNTIYVRLDYNKPSSTVVNVRKSMWIHPTHNRAISIREAARLQTFPDSFKFFGPKDAQYQQVSNAVPPILAKAIAVNILSMLCKGKK